MEKPMLREQFSDTLKTWMKDKDALGVSTVRLILAKLKEQDIEARAKGKTAIDEAQIHQMLQGMIKQRRESIALYEQGQRQDLADKAIAEIVAATGAQSLKDMGKVMAAIRDKMPGRIDNVRASGIVKKLLGAP
jgi:uncharacterized protein